VVIVITAMCIVLIMVAVAFAVDISSQVNEKHRLHDSLDTAAHAGAFNLPDSITQARADALAFVEKNFPGAPTPTIDFWCIVGALPGPVVNPDHIPATCNPGSGPYTVAKYPGMACSTTICAIPCSGAAGTKCNTIRVADSKVVPYNFAPVVGINEGSTGTLVSAACRGGCGTLAPTPIDFAVVADRTGSMSGYYDELGAGMKGLLQALNPTYHSVALGTISMSSKTAPASCPTQANGSVVSGSGWSSTGTWMPVSFRTDYQSSAGVLNANSPLVKGVNCIAGGGSSGTGTWFAAPMKAAADELSTKGRSDARKVLIFETDGEPNEDSVSASPGGSTNGTTACNNAKTQATSAKSKGIIVVTIAFRLQNLRCNGGTTEFVTAALASMASPDPTTGVASDDDGCNGGTAATIAAENSDGDYFFCTSGTPSAADLEFIYKTVADQVNKGIRLLSIPS
jgi:hypothetical protein